MSRPKGIPAWNKGKTNIELYGSEKAEQLSKLAAENAKRTKNHLRHEHSEESKEKNRQAHIGKPSGNRGNPSNYHHSPEVIEQIRLASTGRKYTRGPQTAESNRKRSEKLKGRSYLDVLGSQERVDERNRKHALSMRKTWEEYWAEHHLEIRDTTQYYEWRKAVLDRDNRTCQHCHITEDQLPKVGHVVETNMHTHHIKSWKEFPDLRYVVENGITLCCKCHREEETRLAIERKDTQV